MKMRFLLILLLTLPLAAQMGRQDGMVPDGMMPEGGPKVLFIYEETVFKSRLIAGMERMLAMSGVSVTKVEHGEDIDIAANPADYEAVFITNSGARAMVRPWITAWLKQQRDFKDRIILHTTQRTDWEVETFVDAVTSASVEKEDEVRQLVVRYCGLIMRKLMPAPPPPAPADE